MHTPPSISTGISGLSPLELDFPLIGPLRPLPSAPSLLDTLPPILPQGLWLRRTAMLRLRTAVRAAVVLQSLWRRRQAVQRAQAVRRDRAAIVLQSFWRRRVAMRHLQSCRQAAVVVQAAVRGWAARLQLQRATGAAGTIQRCARGMLVRLRLARERAMQQAVAEFQRTMGVYAARCACMFWGWFGCAGCVALWLGCL